MTYQFNQIMLQIKNDYTVFWNHKLAYEVKITCPNKIIVFLSFSNASSDDNV